MNSQPGVDDRPEAEQTIFLQPQQHRPAPLPPPQYPQPDMTMANMSQVMSEIERDRLLKSLGQSSGTNASSSQGNDNVAGGRSVRFSSAISRGPSGKQQATRDTGLSAAAVAGVSRLSVNSTAETLIGSQKAEHNEEEDDEDLYLMQVIEPPAQQQKRRTAAASAPSEPSEFPKRPLLAASLSPPNGTISAQMQQPKQKAAMKQTVSDPRLKQVLTTSSPDPHQAQQQPVIRPPLNSGKFIQQAIARLAAEPFDQTALHNRMPATMTKLRRQAAAEALHTSADYQSKIPALSAPELHLPSGIPRAKKSVDMSWKKTLCHRPVLSEINIPEWSLLTAAGQQFGPQTLMTEFMHSSKRPRPINDEQQQQLEIASKSLNFEDWERMRFHERPIAIDEDFCIDDQLLSHNNSKSSSK